LRDNWWQAVAKKVPRGEPSMKSEAVSLPVIAGVPLDCSFWLEDDGWSGVCERLSVIVRGGSFEDAKKNMEAALQEHVERVLREYLGRSSQRIA
jgi:predicted RNase H-like HicB family nuclease